MSYLFDALSVALAVVLCGTVAIVAYLVFLTLSALLTRPVGPSPARQIRRFAILVPAHNEEAVIGRLVSNLAALEYPVGRFDICVVADNCTDATAAIARGLGARVYERFSEVERAKGYALRWLLQQLKDEQRTYDAFVVVDADSVVDRAFLTSMNARLEAGAEAIQAYYSVLNTGQRSVAGLRFAALAAVHYLRPLGRSRFGLSVGLKGNGMCFSAPLLERFGWNWFTLAEDVEFHLGLVAAGIRVEFAPETWVKADMPVTLAQAASQNARWERGRAQMLRRQVPSLLWRGLRGRSWLRIDAAIEQLIPPLSLPFAIGVLATPAALLLGNPTLAAIAAGCVIANAAYLLAALALVRAPLNVYFTLTAAPVYIVWKVGLYARSVVGGRTDAWVRTARTPNSASTS